MSIRKVNIEERLGTEYLNHNVFKKIQKYSDFYNDLSFSIMYWVSSGTTGIINFDTYVYSSISGTLDSIKEILGKGRLNDAYALLRKYYDSTIINVYTNVYLIENVGIENLIVKQIDNWLKGKESIPNIRKINDYLKKSKKLKPILVLLDKDNFLKKTRERCNDNVHYNYYYNVLLNDNAIYIENRLKYLDNLEKDLDNIFLQHLGLIFFLNDHYMISSDYGDSLDLGLTPEENSQYWVAPFVQDILDKTIRENKPDLYEFIKNRTEMQLA